MKNKGKVVKYYIAFTILAVIIALVLTGWNVGFILGLGVGMAAFIVNLVILEKVIYDLTTGKNKIRSFLLYTGRFLIFAAAGGICALSGIPAVIALGVSAIIFFASVSIAAAGRRDPA